MARNAVSDNTDKINTAADVVISISVRAIVYIIVAAVFYYGTAGAYWFGFSMFSRRVMTSAPGIEMQVSVDQKDSALDIGKRLEKMGLIHDAWAFVCQKYFYEIDIRPGSYTLNTAMTVKEALEAMDSDRQKSEGVEK